MRVGFKLRRIPLRLEMDGGPIDAEWLLRLAHGSDLYVHVDEDGPGASMLRAAGIDVHIAPKRLVDIGGQATGDEAALRHLEAVHRQAPLDRLVIGGDIGMDPRWHTTDFAGVPVLMTLGEEPHRLAPLVVDRHLAQQHLTAVWAASGALAAADALLGWAPPSAYSLRDLDRVPRLGAGVPSAVVDDGPRNPGLVVVVATVASQAQLGSLAFRLSERVDIGPATSIVCVVSDIPMGADTAGSVVMAGAPVAMRHAIVVAHTGPDGVAKAFLDRADLIVGLGAADLAIPAVAERSQSCPTISLEPGPTVDALPWEEPVGVKAAADVPAQVLSAEDGMAAVADLIEGSDAPVHVIHTTGGSALALRIVEHGAGRHGGVTILCQADLVHGTPRPERPIPSVVAIDRAVALPAARLLRSSDDLWSFIRVVLDPSNAGRLHLRLLPAPLGSRATDIALAPEGLPQWFGTGPLVSAGGVSLTRTEAAEPRPVRAQGPSMRAWVKQHRWPDRIRLALPWKGGLLERAMKDRW